MALSDTSIRNAKPAAKAYKLYDSDGLFMQITPNGGKWWRLKYRFDSKEKLLSLSPQSRIAILGAAMELKQLRKVKLDRK